MPLLRDPVGVIMNWKRLEFEAQVKYLERTLSPRRSRLRPYLALYALKNYLLLKNGFLVQNSPSVTWYLRQLTRSGIPVNFWNVRGQLKYLAARGILKEVKTVRSVRNSARRVGRLTRIQVSEFYLNEDCFLSTSQALKKIFKVESLAELYGR